MRTSIIKSVGALALTAAGTAFVFGFRTSESVVDPGSSTARTSTTTTGSAGSAGSTGATGSGAAGATGSAAAGATATGAPAAIDASTAAYADGTWTGSAVSEPWGAFEVQVVVSNGTIASVTVVESPSDGRSTRINNRAVPLLTQSTIASQDSTVDAVSGATWTSRSYAKSLQSALDQAANAA